MLSGPATGNYAQPASLSSLNAARAAAGLKPGQLDPSSALGTRPQVGVGGAGRGRHWHVCGTSSYPACKAAVIRKHGYSAVSFASAFVFSKVEFCGREALPLP